MQLSKQREFRETDESRKALADLALQANVRAALRADPHTRSLSFAVDSDGAKIRMRGIVATREESNSAARVAMGVPGVLEIGRAACRERVEGERVARGARKAQ